MKSFTITDEAIKDYEEREKHLVKKLKLIMNLPDELKEKELENIAGFLICYETILSSISDMGKNVGELNENLFVRASDASLTIFKNWNRI